MTSLKEGDKAPNFSVLNQDDKLLTLDTYKGKKLILYFYPKDSTPGCTAESCNLRDNYSELLDLGYDVLGVSADNSASHKKFITKNELPFHLLSDTEKKSLRLMMFGGLKNLWGRSMKVFIEQPLLLTKMDLLSVSLQR